MRYFVLLIALISHQIGNAQITLPDNMYGDTVNAPFIYGVASGDPLHDGVIIWTKVDTASTSTIEIDYEISALADFSYIFQSGSTTTDTSVNYTVKLDITGLNPNTIYYYRFITKDGSTSAHGRTRTAPAPGTVNTHVRFAVTSCSSIYSGYFNGYARIAERSDIDFVMNVGDYMYDFVDQDEEVRVPTPYPSVPSGKNEWRERHEYYLLDPDLREARRQHPWIVIWDNHDIASLSDPDLIGSMEAFWEYVPIRQPDLSDPTRIYRKMQYGALMDIVMIDMYSKRDQDLITPTEYHVLGQAQDFWLRNELLNTIARWKIVGNQKIIAGWSVIGLPSWFPGSGNGTFFDEKTWDGYDAARDQVLEHIRDNDIDNVVFMTGDSHLTLVADCSDDPYDAGNYTGSSGAGSIACEFLPTSVTRGNFDEMGISSALLPLAVGLNLAANPNHVHAEFTKHGYGIIDVSPDTLIAEVWYSEILSQTNQEEFGDGYYILNGRNHWERGTLNSPTSPKDTTDLVDIVEHNNYLFNVFPNPTAGTIYLVPKNRNTPHLASIRSYDIVSVATGQVIKSESFETPKELLEVNASNLAAGQYVLRVFSDMSDSQFHQCRFIKLGE